MWGFCKNIWISSVENDQNRSSARLLAFSFFPLTRYPSFLDLHRQCALPVTNPRGSLRYKTEMPTDRRWLLKKSAGSEQIPRIDGTMEAVRKQYRKLFYAGPTRGGCRWHETKFNPLSKIRAHFSVYIYKIYIYRSFLFRSLFHSSRVIKLNEKWYK